MNIRFSLLDELFSDKRFTIPFYGLLAASAVLVYKVAFSKKTQDKSSNPDSEVSPDIMALRAEPEPEVEELTAGIEEVLAESQDEEFAGAQCKAITKKGTRCKNKADESGYCRQHKPA